MPTMVEMPQEVVTRLLRTFEDIMDDSAAEGHWDIYEAAMEGYQLLADEAGE